MDSVHLAPRIQLAHHRLADDAIEWGALNALSRRFGLELLPHVLWTVSGQRVEVEGADPAGKVLVQVVANRGQLKSFHRNKILADMLKLSWIRQSGFQASRIVVCVNDTLARAFQPFRMGCCGGSRNERHGSRPCRTRPARRHPRA